MKKIKNLLPRNELKTTKARAHRRNTKRCVGDCERAFVPEKEQRKIL